MNKHLKPAVAYQDQLFKLFEKELYSENFFSYTGYVGSNSVPSVNPMDDRYQYVIVNSEDKVIGYLAYHMDSNFDTVNKFGLYSFDHSNYLIGKVLFEEMERLCGLCRRIEWRMIGGNPVEKHYDSFCEMHGGNKITLHKVAKNLDGEYFDEHIYEIVKEN